MEKGVRLLDIRLSVTLTDDDFRITTAHGDAGSYFNLNEYQTFISVLEECVEFLTKHVGEFIAMSLKVDDWNNVDDVNKMNFYTYLSNNVLWKYKSRIVGHYEIVPTLADVAGKIYLLNRMTDNNDLGAPMSWINNTSGMVAYGRSRVVKGEKIENRNFDIYVQDQYEDLGDYPSWTKWGVFLQALKLNDSKEHANYMNINFASGTKCSIPIIGSNILITNIIYYFLLTSETWRRRIGQ